MIFLHTSDWHLGHTLYSTRRHEEFSAFLEWLLERLKETRADALLVAGDVFDTAVVGPQAQKLYYDFLRRVRDAGCRHAVIIAGNHDSPTFLDAPAEILRVLSVHVIGSARANPQDEVITLYDAHGNIEALVCAIPFLRDRDVRRQEEGESAGDKETRLVQGIAAHVQAVCGHALQIRRESGRFFPVVAMAHLYTDDEAPSDDSLRPLYVGALGRVPVSIFPDGLDYVALGHLHRVPKPGNPRVRYSGSPLPMSFADADNPRHCLCVEIDERNFDVWEIPVPVFRHIECVSGNFQEIRERLAALKDSGALVEVLHTGSELSAGLREVIEESCAGGTVEVVRFGSVRELAASAAGIGDESGEMPVLDKNQVFELRLNACNPPLDDAEKERLRVLYAQALEWLRHRETAAGGENQEA